jgi:mRNA-degrading endonuclease RelE of RelBE toxin-antitoxin system
MTLVIEIEHSKQKSLEILAEQKGKQVSEFVKEIVDDYLVQQAAAEKEAIFETQNLMKLSETSFNEWDNDEDAIYDKL